MINMFLHEIEKILLEQKYANPSPSNENNQFEGVSIDTRTLVPGNLFIAIAGGQFDGHDFVKEASKKGAAAAIVQHKIEAPIKQIVVNNTLDALGKLSLYWRNRFSLPLIGITGSNGKTTLKNMTASILRAACQNPEEVLSTVGNYNNNIGVPLTLFRLNQRHRFGVIEMGMNHFGEIAYLTSLTKPHIALITNAAEAHLEGLQSVSGVAKAKGEIFLGLDNDGIAILNCDDPHYDYWRDLINGHNSISFGLKNLSDVTAIGSINTPAMTIQTPKGNITLTLPLLGQHNKMNALAASAIAIALDIDLAAIKQGLETVADAPGRMKQYFLSNGARIIDDTYNANPFSVQAAIHTLADFDGMNVLVLGDMKELGPEAKQYHFLIGQKMREARIHFLYTLGEISHATTEGFGEGAIHFTDRQKLIDAIQPYLKKGTNLLVKGSRSMKMEEIIKAIVPENQLEHVH